VRRDAFGEVKGATIRMSFHPRTLALSEARSLNATSTPTFQMWVG
jgi:hypothetical protein